MAKKKNENIVIIDKELTPTIIGKLDTKEKSPILLIVIFIVLIAVAIFLPDITSYIENSKNNNKVVEHNPNETEKPEENIGETEEIVYYDYIDGLTIPTNIFELINFSHSNNLLTFEINNPSDSIFNSETEKYFLEIYSSDKTLLQRYKISNEMINNGGVYSFELDAETSKQLTKLTLNKKSVEDYPEVELNINDEGKGILTCTKGYETITYTFGNEYLVGINNIVNFPASNDITYTTNLQKYQVMAATYNNYEGVSSTLINNSTGFTFTTLIDLEKADITVLDNNNYYNYRTLSKVVKFETESNGYSCN